MASKIIVLGDVNGQLHEAFKKLGAQQTKNNFTFAIISGNLFAEDNDAVGELLDNKITIPLPTYFTLGTTPLPQRIIEKLKTDEDICENLHFLGKCSTTKTLEGLRIVALGGVPDPSQPAGLSQDKYTPFHTIGDAKSLYGAHSADILITATWPASIQNESKKLPDGVTPPNGAEHIADLCMTLKPRYHFSSAPDFFFEREPFLQQSSLDSPDFKPFTRFFSLAPFGNSSKQKALYAFALATKVDESILPPQGTTKAPFSLRKRKRAPLEPEPFSRYGGDDRGRRDFKRGRGGRGQKKPPPGPEDCFFCLSRVESQAHLIVAIGEDAYMTISKGPLIRTDTFKEHGLEIPAHALIIPIPHNPTLASIQPEHGDRTNVYNEMCRFRNGLQKMVAQNSNNQLGAVTFEISWQRGIHDVWQFFPIPATLIKKNLVEAAFRIEGENLRYEPFEVTDPGLGEKEGDFFRVWIWTPPSEEAPSGSIKCLTMPIEDNRVRFSIMFGRQTLAKLLGLEKRIQWRDCEQPKEEEANDALALKRAFIPYNFTNDDWTADPEYNVQVSGVKMNEVETGDATTSENAKAEDTTVNGVKAHDA